METVDGNLPAPTDDTTAGRFAGPTYESPFPRPDDLSPEQIALLDGFKRDGYAILDDVGLPDFDAVAEQVKQDLAPYHQGNTYNRVQDAWVVSDAARQIALAPKVLATLRLLFGREPVPFQTLHFHRGSQQATHADLIHFHSVPRHFMCGVWTALEAVGPDNGPLHYYPGSHRLSEYEYVDMGLDPETPQVYARYERFMTEMAELAGLEKHTLRLETGQAIIWSSGLWHGGEPINDPNSTRRSQVSHYLFEECVHYSPRQRDLRSDDHAHLFYRDIRTGEWRWPSFNGKPIRLKPSTRARFAGVQMLDRVGRRKYTSVYRT